MSESTDQHRQAAAGQTAACAVLTVSDSRTPETDGGGDAIVEALGAGGHRIVARRIEKDEPHDIGRVIGEWVREPEIQVVITTGGTGISSRDGTVEVVLRYLDKRLDGFGELFRMLSWQEVGSAAMLSRAVAGLAHETLIFALPGSPAAVRLAMSRLILPELPHLLFERSR
jgi:molybdopterin adenylyltransferase